MEKSRKNAHFARNLRAAEEEWSFHALLKRITPVIALSRERPTPTITLIPIFTGSKGHFHEHIQWEMLQTFQQGSVDAVKEKIMRFPKMCVTQISCQWWTNTEEGPKCYRLVFSTTQLCDIIVLRAGATRWFTNRWPMKHLICSTISRKKSQRHRFEIFMWINVYTQFGYWANNKSGP